MEYIDALQAIERGEKADQDTLLCLKEAGFINLADVTHMQSPGPEFIFVGFTVEGLRLLKQSKLPLVDDQEREIILAVVRGFLDRHEATSKRALLKQLKSSIKQFQSSLTEPLRRLVSCSVLHVANNTYLNETYLPRASAFYHCGDSAALAFARKSTEIVLRVLPNLFDRDLDSESKEQKQFTSEEVEKEARAIDSSVAVDMIFTGLYLAQESSVFSGTQSDDRQLGIISFSLSERVYETRYMDWDEHIRQSNVSLVHDRARNSESPPLGVPSSRPLHLQSLDLQSVLPRLNSYSGAEQNIGQGEEPTMTREDERPEVVRKLVVVFDTCSSTNILEDLKRTDNLSAWRNLLIGMKEWLLEIGDELGMELYKFVGDGWILLFPDRTAKEKLCEFLQRLSKWFDTEFHKEICDLLERRPAPIGLTFGIDSGELIRLEMNEQVEYIGRAINMASRLQGQSKEVPGGPAYKALFSKSWFNSVPRSPATIKVDPVKVSLRNIVTGDNYECLVFKTYEPPRVSVQSPQRQNENHSLEIVFEGDTKPYLEEQSTKILTGRKLMDRRYRIGIKNTTRAVVPARVVLENCEPNQHEGVHLGHPLQIMGHPAGTSEISLQPGERPSAFVDVVFDEILEGIPYGNAFGLCYAAPVKQLGIPRGSYLLTLRVEGNGFQTRKQFRIYQEPTTQLLTMRPLD